MKFQKLHPFGLLFLALAGMMFSASCGVTRVEAHPEYAASVLLQQNFDAVPELEMQSVEKSAERHAFMLENNLIFIADVPKDWRYILYPICDYAYYEDFVKTGGEGWRRVKFVGMGENDGDDDFFEIIADRVRSWYDFHNTSFDHSGMQRDYADFSFRDGRPGEWDTVVWEDNLYYMEERAMYYNAFVHDLDMNYYVELDMLKSEYDTNEKDIKKFLESANFRTSDLGVSEEEDVLKRELVTLHIWNPFVQMSLKVPEGAEISYKMTSSYESGYDTCIYYIYLDKEKKNYIEIYPDQCGEFADPTGDYHYYLNIKDFEETVYEMPRPSGYYFRKHNLAFWVRVDKENEELREYAKKIAQSVRFE